MAFVTSWSESAAATVTIDVGDIWFCNPSFQGDVCETRVAVGDTVVWDFSAGDLPHTTTECGASCDSPTSTPLWDSGTFAGSGTFQFTFSQPGTYLYYCEVHPFTQRGEIIVGTVGGIAELPQVAGRPLEAPDGPWPGARVLEGIAAAAGAAAAGWWARRWSPAANAETADPTRRGDKS